jgi:hypothetical protein
MVTRESTDEQIIEAVESLFTLNADNMGKIFVGDLCHKTGKPELDN